MKRKLALSALLLFSISLHPFLAQEIAAAESTGYGEVSEKTSGFYLGGDSGILVPLGNSGNVFSPHFISAAKFGYSLKRRFNFQLRLIEANGRLDRNHSSTFFFMTEFNAKIHLTKTAFRPFLLGGVGFYLLSFSGSDPLVKKGTNLTYVGGGGFDYNFGSSAVGLGVNYRGFVNSLRDFKALEIMVGYAFHFF